MTPLVELVEDIRKKLLDVGLIKITKVRQEDPNGLKYSGIGEMYFMLFIIKEDMR